MNDCDILLIETWRLLVFFLVYRKYGESQIVIDSQRCALNIRNQMKIQIRPGIVQWFDEQQNSGGVKISGEPVEAAFSFNTERVLVEGLGAPEFGPNVPAELHIPSSGLKVVCAFKVDYKLEVSPGQRTLRRTVEIVAWNHAESYRDIEQRIASRPVYEVVEFVLYRGKPTSENQRRVIDFGTVQALQTVYPRGVARDPLAQETQAMDFTFRRRFYKRMPDGRKVQCPDPRPLPSWMPEELFQPTLFQPTNEWGELLASADEVSQFVSSRRREKRELVMA